MISFYFAKQGLGHITLKTGQEALESAQTRFQT